MSGTHREWQLDLAKTALRDDTVEVVCEKRVADHRERRKIGKGEKLEYQEIDVSQNRITHHGCQAILGVCLQCLDLRVVKLFKNELSDQAAPSLCRLVQECRVLEQLHLSYNQLTATGAKEIVTAAHRGRSARQKDRGKPGFTLWLRLEHNRIRNSAGLLEELRSSGIDFCEAKDATTCGPRCCKSRASIHLPYFSKQDPEGTASSSSARSSRPPPPSIPGQSKASALSRIRVKEDGAPPATKKSPEAVESEESDGSSSSSSLEVIDLPPAPKAKAKAAAPKSVGSKAGSVGDTSAAAAGTAKGARASNASAAPAAATGAAAGAKAGSVVDAKGDAAKQALKQALKAGDTAAAAAAMGASASNATASGASAAAADTAAGTKAGKVGGAAAASAGSAAAVGNVARAKVGNASEAAAASAGSATSDNAGIVRSATSVADGTSASSVSAISSATTAVGDAAVAPALSSGGAAEAGGKAANAAEKKTPVEPATTTVPDEAKPAAASEPVRSVDAGSDALSEGIASPEPLATTDPYALDVDLELEDGELPNVQLTSRSPSPASPVHLTSPPREAPEKTEAEPEKAIVAPASVLASPTSAATTVLASPPASPQTEGRAEPAVATDDKSSIAGCQGRVRVAASSAVGSKAAPPAAGSKAGPPAAGSPPAVGSKAASPAVGSKAASPAVGSRASPAVGSKAASPAVGSKASDAQAKKAPAPAADSSDAGVSRRREVRSRSRDDAAKGTGDGSKSNQRVESRSERAEESTGADNQKAREATSAEHRKKAKKEKGDKKRKVSSEGSGGSKSRKRRKHQREAPETQTRDAKEVAKDAKETKDAKDVKEVKDAKDTKEAKETKEAGKAAVKEAKEAKEAAVKEAKEAGKEKAEKKRKEGSEGSGRSKSRKRRKHQRDAPETQTRDAKEVAKDAKEVKEVKEAKEAKDDPAAVKDAKEAGKAPPKAQPKDPRAQLLAMRPAQLSKKSTKLAEVKEAFGLDDDEDIPVKSDAKDSKDAKVQDAKDAKEAKDTKETKDPKEAKDKGSAADDKDAKDPKDGKHSKHKKESKEAKSQKAGKEGKDSKEGAFDAGPDAAKRKSKFGDGPTEEKPKAKAKGISGLGNIAELQKQIADERAKLRLFVIKAKQEWEEKHDRDKARGETNEQEYYIASTGEVFGANKEFKIEASIGRGVFSSVFQCKDVAEEKSYAVKFVRANHMMRKAADKEVELYRRLKNQAPKEDAEAAQFLMILSGPETLIHHGHLSMIFELQKCDLRVALSKYGQGKGLPLQTVAQYVRQIFLCLRVLRKMKIIHGDLKPDNILMSLSKTEVKVCDFGASMDVSEQVKTAYVQPRYYRAPEIILGTPYDTQIDLWSAGVTTYELGTGRILFSGRTNNAMLRDMLDVCGEFPRQMTKEGTYASKHFNSNGDLIHKAPDTMTGEPEVLKMKNFQRPPKPIAGLVEKVLKEPPPNADRQTQERLLPRLSDLVTKCLRINPSERFTPDQALAHTFFKKDKPKDAEAIF